MPVFRPDSYVQFAQPLLEAFNVDALGIRSEQVARNLYFQYSSQPVYFNLTYRAPTGFIISGIVRYHSSSSKCPEALIVNGQMCDQIVIGVLLHSARAKGTQTTT
ncbi:uncharacterized protein PHALS_07087 [Plasmopara halstedii]|uniref:Uncharacterized protein n=1 Tax=Plasmopara halstedii TaxID=4781 RepID=A0A0P1B4L4_PLAHL|nr:uncharacterized protein PHALS_07087 [Plasmopara halstedii]CEG49317.1 hypothetical protein PHALS_07087 [Plasmopara halstedii]|eukprot:XP_024585686.1 hypothetical protein PHALS_07087 [Plasmopara halstedii]